MSCLDVMYHQSYGAHYLPAAAYKATYYNQQQQQRKLSVYTKMQECMEQQSIGSRGMLPHRQTTAPGHIRRFPSDSDLKDCSQPAEAEYLSARCVLFTYFRGEIGDVVDEHFSRALSQARSFNSESKPLRVTQPTGSTSAGAWKDDSSPIESQSHSGWTTSSCSSQPRVPGHPDFCSSPVSFPPEGSLWTGHVFTQTSLPPPPPPPPSNTLSDSWTYSPQTSPSYPNVHDVYHPHSYSGMHPHHHPMLHSYPTQCSTLDARFSPLLLPSARNQSQPSASSSPLSEGVKTELESSSPSTPISWAPPARTDHSRCTIRAHTPECHSCRQLLDYSLKNAENGCCFYIFFAAQSQSEIWF
uniref:Vestigial-like family member 3 n=1 Tax=Neogobius melanostomus TaxID=47308 RepID=A0A8C6SCB2_9GOBI